MVSYFPITGTNVFFYSQAEFQSEFNQLNQSGQ